MYVCEFYYKGWSNGQFGPLSTNYKVRFLEKYAQNHQLYLGFFVLCKYFSTFAKNYHIMNTNRKITIFLASSEELINDRNSFHSLIFNS